MTTRELYGLALDTYGPEAQTRMVFEEMAELQKELCKNARGQDNRRHIAEEIADVEIMLEQMMVLHDCESLVAGYKKYKLDRLEERLKENAFPSIQIGQSYTLDEIIGGANGHQPD